MEDSSRRSVVESLEDGQKEEDATDILAQVARLSISHDGEYAIAMVMVADQRPGSDEVDMI